MAVFHTKTAVFRPSPDQKSKMALFRLREDFSKKFCTQGFHTCGEPSELFLHALRFVMSCTRSAGSWKGERTRELQRISVRPGGREARGYARPPNAAQSPGRTSRQYVTQCITTALLAAMLRTLTYTFQPCVLRAPNPPPLPRWYGYPYTATAGTGFSVRRGQLPA
jgi:hypothetical protein